MSGVFTIIERMSMTLVQSTAMAVLLSVFLTACGGGGGGGSTTTTTTTTGSNTTDTDGDGVIDSLDAFPNNKDEIMDSDGDGVGNNADVFPFNPNRTLFKVSGRITGMTGLLSISINGNTKLYDSNDTFEFKLGKNINLAMTLKADRFVCSSSIVNHVVQYDISDIKVTCSPDSDGDGTIDSIDAFPNDPMRFKVDSDAHSYKPKFDVGFSGIVNLNDTGEAETENVENIARLVNEVYDNTVLKIIAGIAKKSWTKPSTLEGAVATWNSQLNEKFVYTDPTGVKYDFTLVEYKSDSSFKVDIRNNRKDKSFTVSDSDFFKNKIIESNSNDAADRELKLFSYHPGEFWEVDVSITVNDGAVSLFWLLERAGGGKGGQILAQMYTSASTADYTVTSSYGKPKGVPIGYVEFDKNTAELEFRNKVSDVRAKANYNQNKDILEWVK